MKKTTKLLASISGFVVLMLAGAALHVPQWVARAAAIYSSPMSDVLNAYRQPYQSTVNASCSGIICQALATAPPAGHRLVIQHFAMNASTFQTVTATVYLAGALPAAHYIPTLVTPAGNSVTFNEPVLMYFDPGDTPAVQITVSGPSTPAIGGFQATLIGYLENCTAYPGGVCPAVVN